MSPVELQVQEKKELQGTEEPTQEGRHYVPYTDIYEAKDVIKVTMDMPGVEKDSVDVSLEKSVLTISGKVDLSKYEGLRPVYTEYNIGNYLRHFTISDEIDRSNITAKVADGVLTVTLPKIADAKPRRIPVS